MAFPSMACLPFLKQIERRYLVSSSITFAFGLVHCVFNFYYVKVFLNIYKVSESWFQFSQVIYMIWNSINDPIFGYLLNNPKWKCSTSRRLPILYGSPIYALTFLVPWFSWADYRHNETLCGVHLVVSLCLYDTLFTYIGLTSCCLTAEMFTSYPQRIKMKWFSSIAVIASAWSIPSCNLVSNNLENFAAFQMMTVFLAVFAFLVLYYAGTNAYTVYEDSSPVDQKPEDNIPVCSGSSCYVAKALPSLGENAGSKESSRGMTWLVLTSRDFHAFIWTEFLQAFHLTYWSNFTTIMVDTFVHTSTMGKSVFFGALSLAPAVTFLCTQRIFESVGYFRLIRGACVLKIAISSCMYLIGPSPYLFLLYIFVDHVSGETWYRLVDIILSDISDKIMTQSDLSHPRSSVLVGLNAFFIKPAQSIAPMLAVHILNQSGYSSWLKGELTDPTLVTHLHSTMFTLCCALPFFVGLLQLFIWSFYTIQPSYKILPVSVT